MIKRQQKWIVWLVILVFIWLLRISSMPLAAAYTSEQVSTVNSEQGPHFVEQAGEKGSSARRKSILPYVLIGVGVVAVAAVLFLVVLKAKYDIIGTWSFTFTSVSDSKTWELTFNGTKSAGNYTTKGNPALSGNYSVDGKNVAMTVSAEPTIEITGQFTGKDTMSGIYIENTLYLTWIATRISTIASNPSQPAM